MLRVIEECEGDDEFGPDESHMTLVLSSFPNFADVFSQIVATDFEYAWCVAQNTAPLQRHVISGCTTRRLLATRSPHRAPVCSN